MPAPVTSTARRVLIFAWVLVLSLPAVALSVAYGFRNIAAFEIAGETSDRWAAIAAATLKKNPPTAQGLSDDAIVALADALAAGSPVRYLVADPTGKVIHASQPDAIGSTLTADTVARVMSAGRVRSNTDLVTNVPLPDAIAESAFPVGDGSSIQAIAVVRIDRTQLFSDIFRLTMIGLATAAGIIALLGALVTYQLSRHFRERAQIESRIRHDREVMELALAAAEAGYFERDLSGDAMRWSSRLKEILGFPESFEPSFDFFNSLVHSDDEPTLFRNVQRLRDFGLPFTTEVRARHTSGTMIWLRIRVAAQKDGDGNVVRHVGLLRDVTYERKTLDALTASEAKFRNLIEGSIQGVVVYENFKPLFCNDAYARLLGYASREDLLAIPSLLVHVDADIRAKSEKLWALALQGQLDTQPSRRRFIDKSGKEKWLLTIGNLIDWDGRKALLATAVDASDAVKAEQGLRDSEARFRALVESAADLVTLRRLTGELDYASPAAEKITGYSFDELVSAPIEHTIHPDDIPPVIANNKWMRENPGRPAHAVQYRFRHKTGEWIWLERLSTMIPSLSTDGAPRILSISRNITNRVEREIALREARDKLQSQTEELTALARAVDGERLKADRANAAKTRFLAVMSHELRTPMAGILAATDLLQQKPEPAEHDRVLASVSSSARMLLRHLNDILDMSKIESGQFDIDRAPFSLRRIIAEIDALFAPAAAARGNRLSVNILPDVPDAIIGDGPRYRQVLINLIDNANKFTLQGSVDVRLSRSGDTEGPLQLLTEIEDTGVGITADDAAKLFQPFVQVGPKKSGAVGGTGLGLAICKSLVELMGGHIEVRSSPGRGATFRFTIATAPALGRPEEIAATADPALLTRGLKLLLAEDNETNRMLYAAMLGRSGHSVTTAADGAEAVALAEKEPFDAVLMDIQMPVMNGRDAIIAVRSGSGPNAETPIVALTADAFSENHGAYLAAGADTVVTKPVDWTTLADVLRRLTSGTDSEGASPRPNPTRQAPEFEPAIIDTLRGSVSAESFTAIVASVGPNLERYGRDIAAALAADNLTAARRAGHALKGLASQFGLNAVAQTAAAIEARSGSLIDARRHAEPLGQLIVTARSALEAHIAARTTSKT